MSQTKISVHPQIKKIIQNLDLDLDLELSQYEHSRLHDSALIAQSSDPFYANTSAPSVVYQSALIEEAELGEQVIPVASRLINEQTSILDRILTPWGIFGIIFFFGANLFIFLNLDNQTILKALSHHQDKINLNNNQTLPNTVNPEVSSSLEKNVTENNNNSSSLEKIEKPSIPNPLPEVKETSNLNISSPYPDLKTALFTEIKKQQSSSTKSPVATLPTQPTSTQLTTPAVTSQSTNDTENTTPTKYYVISNYKNMNEYNRIKKIVPSAFITNMDKRMKIQLAVFENEKEAKKKAQQLQNKGIDNYLYNSFNAEPGT